MRIICFGDSVTRGISYIRGRLRIQKENYPALLQTAFAVDDDVEVVNKGVFNDNSDLLVLRMEDDVVAARPDYVLIEIGGNDCNFRWGEVASAKDEEHEPIVPLDRYLVNLQKMVERMRQEGATPILMNLLPLDPVRYYNHIYQQHGSNVAHWIACCGGIEHWHGLYNRALVQLVSRLNVLTIDVRTAFKQAADFSVLLSDDGIHPTVAGYRVMAKTVATAFTQFVGAKAASSLPFAEL
ncbi:SGNH/GDSL hydrolase family protein [Alicyclobacillus mengziensis]|uniref:SGNH/GDSL hydrolase family protein n=1 Tax=Alicyclobacillus mengziensis TaxID=2931921 RepID=A0A9X7W0X2_9BACL|nr:SGNH/GDSL hydrolase family protein [Alicyclobacillus mengziensis]QSO48284.1 SGNH/GDSL hydrolase family protein [Alicyclobacillus mengziensis]